MKKRKLVILLAGAVFISQAGYLKAVNITGAEVIAEAAETQDENIISDGTYSYVLNEDGTAKILGFTGNFGPEYRDVGRNLDITIPSQVDKDGEVYKVTVIASNCDYGFGHPNSVTISEGITEIERNAFDGACLKSVSLPESLKKIGDMAFNWCSISNLKLPKSLEYIGDYAFAGNSLDYVELQSEPEMAKNTFYGRNGTLKIDANIKNLDFTKLCTFKNININDDTNYYSKIDGVIYNKDLTEAEYADKNIEASIKMPESVSKINQLCFYSSDFSNVTLPENLEYIGDRAFAESKNITEISIPEGVHYIGENAFDSSKKIEKVSLPKNIKSIEKECFKNCESLKSIVIPEGVTEVKDDAFMWCESLENVTFPKSLNSIGESAFKGCKLVSLDIPDNVEQIGLRAFDMCDALKEVKIEDGKEKSKLKSIESWAFSRCYSLVNINIPESVESIECCAFEECSALESIKISGSVKEVEKNCFTGCKNLRNVIIAEGVTKIGCMCFEGCEALEKIELPESLTSIEYDAFLNCKSLASIEIPKNIEFIGSYTFEKCENLKAIQIDNNSVKLEGTLVYGCDNLNNITFKNGTTMSITTANVRDIDKFARVILKRPETSEVQYVRKGCKVLYDADKYALYKNGQAVTDDVINEDKTFELKAK